MSTLPMVVYNCTYSIIVAGLIKPRISKNQNVQESEKTFLHVF